MERFDWVEKADMRLAALTDASQIEPFPREPGEGQPTPKVCLQSPSILNTSSPGMSYFAPSTPSLSFTKAIDPGLIRSESQQQRYASFSCYGHQFLSKHGPRQLFTLYVNPHP